MAAGIVVGSGLELLLSAQEEDSAVAGFINDYLVYGLFDVLGRIFIASLKLLVVPLVMVSLICGMTSLGSSARMGAIAGRTIGLYLLTTGVAVSLGLLGATLLGPGKGLSIEAASTFQAKTSPSAVKVTDRSSALLASNWTIFAARSVSGITDSPGTETTQS